MDNVKLRAIEDAEHCLFLMLSWLKETEKSLSDINDPERHKKVKQELEAGRIRYSQWLADVVIFKARYQIYTNPKRLK